jgi:hypothetical protein
MPLLVSLQRPIFTGRAALKKTQLPQYGAASEKMHNGGALFRNFVTNLWAQAHSYLTNCPTYL